MDIHNNRAVKKGHEMKTTLLTTVLLAASFAGANDLECQYGKTLHISCSSYSSWIYAVNELEVLAHSEIGEVCSSSILCAGQECSVSVACEALRYGALIVTCRAKGHSPVAFDQARSFLFEVNDHTGCSEINDVTWIDPYATTELAVHIAEEIHSDGFESGDLSGWQQ